MGLPIKKIKTEGGQESSESDLEFVTISKGNKIKRLLNQIKIPNLFQNKLLKILLWTLAK